MIERPCKYCIANWAGMSKSHPPIVPEPVDCDFTHGQHDVNDQRVYALAAALARCCCGTRTPSDEQTGWFLGDADQVVDDFDPTPEVWKVRKLPTSPNDGFDGITQRLRINDVTYVALEGGKGTDGSLVSLKEFRSW